MTKGIKGFLKGNIPWSKGKKLGSKPKHSEDMKNWWVGKKTDPEVIKKRKREYAKKYRTENGEKLRCDTLWRKYKLTPEGLNKILLDQNGKCLICRITLDTSGSKENKPHIDHDHRGGKVRGILCSRCNLFLGKIKDSVEILNEAIKYLNKYV
jgi:hypothetical protein